MKKSKQFHWRILFVNPRLYTVFAILAIVAFIFIFIVGHTQWEQLQIQQEYSRLSIVKEPRTLTQIQREVLRFHVAVSQMDNGMDEDLFTLHRNLVTSRFTVLDKSPYMRDGRESSILRTKAIQNDWDALQPFVDEWVVTEDTVLLEQIKERLAQIEVKINTAIIDESHDSYENVKNFGDSIERNMQALLIGVAGFIFFLSAFLIGLMLSARKLALSQAALIASERQLRATLDTIPDAVARLTREGVFTSFHPGNILALLDSPIGEDAFVGRHINDIFHHSLTEQTIDTIEFALSENEEQRFETTIKTSTSNGIEDQIFEVHIVPIGDNEVLGVLRNVTVERRKEETLFQSQKLESLGLLAGGIAHDFNNILAGIMGQASLAQKREERGMSPTKNISKIIVAAQRAADLTRQLLAYAGKGQFLIELLDVSRLINNDRMLLETVAQQGVDLTFELAEYEIPIKVDKGQIQQILLNLVINAGDAIGAEADGGHIAVRTGIIAMYTADERDVWSQDHPFTPGNYAFFEVEDNGSGMPPEVMSKIFDPFFTTKRTGHGLGLSGTLGIVHRHGGGVRVSSVENQGSEFTVLFPLAEDVAFCTDHNATMNSTFARGNQGTILVADDDAEIREFVTMVLEDVGMKVLTAANGREAVALFAQHQSEITLVVLDMIMPEMNGDEVYRCVREKAELIPVLISSGYGDTAALDFLVSEPYVTFLPKPYPANELLLKIQRLMAENPIDNCKPINVTVQSGQDDDPVQIMNRKHLPDGLHLTPVWV